VEKFKFRRGKDWIEKTVSYFPAVVVGTIQIQPEEIREARWFTFDQALKRLTFEEARSICRHVREMVNQE